MELNGCPLQQYFTNSSTILYLLPKYIYLPREYWHPNIDTEDHRTKGGSCMWNLRPEARRKCCRVGSVFWKNLMPTPLLALITDQLLRCV